MIDTNCAEKILTSYGVQEKITGSEPFIDYNDGTYVKMVIGVTTEKGKNFVIKIVRDEDLEKDADRCERQCAFSEFMRASGICTPRILSAEDKYCTFTEYAGLSCYVTVEENCGKEITALDEETAREIGALMARMHKISLAAGYRIGCGTLFSAVGWNDVDAYPIFCKLCDEYGEKLDGVVVEKIRRRREELYARLEKQWETLPIAGVQGDVSINNLSCGAQGLVIFDYNNAGDLVLVSDLVLEGILTAYEMELPDGVSEEVRPGFYRAFVDGYLSVRVLTEDEKEAYKDIYALYYGLWFSRLHIKENSLKKLLEAGNFDAANALLKKICADMGA